MRTLPVAALAAAFAASGCSSLGLAPPVEGAASMAVGEVRAVRASASPIVDGVANDAAWAMADEVEVALEGIAGPAACRVRAAIHGGTLHLLVRWEDATEDRAHEPWVRGPDGAWKGGPEREDALAVGFPMKGEFTANMLSPVEATWDVWHWKAGRTDPAGRAMDRVHRMTFSDPGGDRYAARLPDGRVLHIARPEDEGTGVTEALPEPAEGSGGPRYRARRPDGSAADVAARGRWEGGWWTLEMARALSTGHADDRDLAGLRRVPFALAVLDRAEDEDHASSGVLVLVFPPDPSW